METINQSINLSVKDKVFYHRQRFFDLMKERYYNILPTLISYKGSSDIVSIDYFVLERYLRKGYNCVVGEDENGIIKFLGTTNNYITELNQNDNHYINIRFFDNVKPKKIYKLISSYDNFKSGNCVIIRNKADNVFSDYEIIDYYVDELAEISLSRYSCILQSKINTIFKGDIGDETITQIVENVYNGTPYIKTSLLFDPEEQIISVKNNTTELLNALKNEYNNKLCELNNLLGINTNFKEKESGLSNVELNGNLNFINANANIYLLERNRQLFKLNKRYNTNLNCEFIEVRNEENNENNRHN